MAFPYPTLIKFKGSSGQPVWVNPLNVGYLTALGEGTRIVLGSDYSVFVDDKPEAVADVIDRKLQP